MGGSPSEHCDGRSSYRFIWLWNSFVIYSFWSSNAICWYRSGSILAQVMDCCLTAPSHYLNQFWLIINVFCGIHLRAILPEALMNFICDMCSAISQLHFSNYYYIFQVIVNGLQLPHLIRSSFSPAWGIFPLEITTLCTPLLYHTVPGHLLSV